jgi:hypothetical protein
MVRISTFMVCVREILISRLASSCEVALVSYYQASSLHGSLSALSDKVARRQRWYKVSYIIKPRMDLA